VKTPLLTVKSTLLVNMPKRRLESRSKPVLQHMSCQRSVSLCSHLQTRRKISKEKLHELLLPLTRKQTVSPHLSIPLFGETIGISAPAVQEGVLLAHSCLLPPSNTHQQAEKQVMRMCLSEGFTQFTGRGTSLLAAGKPGCG